VNDVDGYERWLDKVSKGLDESLAEPVDVERNLARVKEEGEQRLADPEQRFRQAIDNGDPRGYLDLGEYLMSVGEWAAAEQSLQRALALGLQDALVWMGVLMEQHGQLSEAIFYYQLAAQKDIEGGTELLDAALRRRNGHGDVDQPRTRSRDRSGPYGQLFHLRGAVVPPGPPGQVGGGGLDIGRPAAGPGHMLPGDFPRTFAGPPRAPRPVLRPTSPPLRSALEHRVARAAAASYGGPPSTSDDPPSTGQERRLDGESWTPTTEDPGGRL
jgi:hypothetical protein